MLRETKEIIIKDKKYLIGKIPVTDAREIFSQYLPSACPKLGSYNLNHSLMLKLMSYCGAFDVDENIINLTSKTLIDNNVPDLESLYRLEYAIAEYNIDFLEKGRLLTSLQGIAQSFQGKTTEILTHLLGSLFPKNSQPTQN